MGSLKQPLPNVQLEMLKAFSHDLNEPELVRLRKLLAEFFADIATQEADKAWDEQGWNEAKVQELLNSKLRGTKPKG